MSNGVDEFFGDTIASKFSIDHTGDFGFTAILDYFLETEYAGKYANLFYVIGDGTFEFMEGVLVDEKGFVSYKFTHASDYIIAVTDVEYTGQELNPKPAEPTEEKATQVSEDVVSDSSTENENADNSTVTTTDDKATQTSNTVGKTESIYMNPLFYVAIAVALLAIIFVAFTFIKKKKN